MPSEKKLDTVLFCQAEDGIRDLTVTGVQTCALPISHARAYEQGGATAISVLTDERHFGGTLDDLSRVARCVSVPVLRKDFILDELQLYETRAAGASAALLIVRALAPERLRALAGAARGPALGGGPGGPSGGPPGLSLSPAAA